MTELQVQLPGNPYRIVIETGALDMLGGLVRQVAPHDRALLAIDQSIADVHSPPVHASLAKAGYQVVSCILDASEEQKSLATVERLYREFLEHRLERTSPVIAFGGGIVGDTAGFAAATYLRGVPLVHVPTTLLAMVDASIGGKTGVNVRLPQTNGLGKNLIGAFWQPRLVVADPLVLATLDDRDYRCGLAECIKHSLIDSPDLFAFMEQNVAGIRGLDMDILPDLIGRAAVVKTRIVADDERESGRRELLNLGHTFGHAIESIDTLGWRHGEAVAIGLVAASKFAEARKTFSAEDGERLQRLINSFELPTRLSGVDTDTLCAAMHYDKKVRDGRIRLVLPRSIGECEVIDDATDVEIGNAWREVGAT